MKLQNVILTVALAVGGSVVNAGDYLYPGTTLWPGQMIVSSAGKYSLNMQTDGNLVMYRSDGTVRYRFASHGWFAIMQNDGNFVEYNGLVSPIWNAGTWGNPGALLHIQDDGNLVVYSQLWTPLWNIGAEPEKKDPRLYADVVGRDLDAPIGGFLGHLGLYDGAGYVIEAETTGLRKITLNQFKSTTHNYWGTASSNIPAGITQTGCYQAQCWIDWYGNNNYEQPEMRNAIVETAYAALKIGATYTIEADWQPYEWGYGNTAPVRGKFRCDTFVLAMLMMPRPYQVTSTVRSNWRDFIGKFALLDAKTPQIVFDRLSAYH